MEYQREFKMYAFKFEFIINNMIVTKTVIAESHYEARGKLPALAERIELIGKTIL